MPACAASRGLVRISQLELVNTRVTDSGLPELAALKLDEYLGLDGTRVTDAGVAQLGRIQGLRDVGLSAPT